MVTITSLHNAHLSDELRHGAPLWMRRLSKNISNAISSNPGLKNEEPSEAKPLRPKPDNWHQNTNVPIPQIDILAATPPQERSPSPRPIVSRSPSLVGSTLSRRSSYAESASSPRLSITSNTPSRSSSLRRKREPPPLPEGEFSIAARSKLRYKLERRGSNASQRSLPRQKDNPSQSLRSSRRHSSTSMPDTPQILSTDEVKEQKKKNRRSAPPAPFPPMPSFLVCSDEIRALKENNRQSAPLPFRLPSIPDSPVGVLFRDPWLEDRHRESTGIVEDQPFRPDSVISPKTAFLKPALLSPPLRSPSSQQEYTKEVFRKKRDISHYPASAQRYLWALEVEGHAPFVLSSIHVHRRPSTGFPWDLYTPSPPLQAVPKREIESRDWKEGDRGKRKFDRDSGYWGWVTDLFPSE